mmetsp:Transcript_18823/g.59963  ORF Transcript_18823/g.59963 Transcript_18823/m.59963 type:complete len:258 (-) Transcript_18823:97-870(-)
MKMQPRAPPHSRSVFPGVFVSAHPVAILPLPVVIARRLTQRLRGGGARSGDLLGVADRRQQVLFGKGAHQPLELLLVEDAALVEEEADGAVQLAEVVARDGEAARLPLGLAARQQGRQRLLRLPAVVPEVRGGHAACWGSDDDPARPPHRQEAVEPVEPVSKRPQPERPRPVPHGRDVDSEHVRVSRHIGRDAEGGGAGEGGAAPARIGAWMEVRSLEEGGCYHCCCCCCCCFYYYCYCYCCCTGCCCCCSCSQPGL